MRVCIDISAGVHGRAGLGRYANGLAAALATAGGEQDYSVFYNDAAHAQAPAALTALPRLEIAAANKPWRLRVLLAHLLRRPQDGMFPGVDVFHGADHLLPYLNKTAGVFTLHDLTPQFFPTTHTRWNRWFLSLMMPRFLRAADAIVADSQSTRADAIRLYGVAENKIRVVYPGVDARFCPQAPQAVADVRRRYNLPQRFVLYVGTIEPRKNLVRLVEAFARLGPPAAKPALVIAGRKGWLSAPVYERVAGLGLRESIIFPGFINDDDLPALYAAADIFVYPSLYEGFGFPVVEAMACGTPVVCSNTSSLPEVAGDAGLLVDPQDVAAWCSTMKLLLEDDSLRQQLRERGLKQARRFTWAETARACRTVYREVYDRKQRSP